MCQKDSTKYELQKSQVGDWFMQWPSHVALFQMLSERDGVRHLITVLPHPNWMFFFSSEEKETEKCPDGLRKKRTK